MCRPKPRHATRSHLRVWPPVQIGAFAGSGVLLVVGFIHMLLPAQEALTDPCLSEGWLSAYPSFAFLFCVLTIIFMQCLDYLVNAAIDRGLGPTPSAAAAVTPSPAPAPACTDDRSMEGVEAGDCVRHPVCKDEECGGRTLLPGAAVRAKRISALALSETSIAVHSVVIGLALGVTSSSEFTPLFVAIIFHQVSRLCGSTTHT